MVYKKYIKRNGKKFGPYYYESYREDGRVKTRFVSGPRKIDRFMNKNFLFFILFLFLIISLLIGFSGSVKNYVKFAGNTINDFIENSEECSQWGECQYSYNIDYLYGDVYLTGIQNRTCWINDKKIETRRCISKKLITTKKVDDYLEVYEDDKLVSKLELIDEEIDKLNIEINS